MPATPTGWMPASSTSLRAWTDVRFTVVGRNPHEAVGGRHGVQAAGLDAATVRKR